MSGHTPGPWKVSHCTRRSGKGDRVYGEWVTHVHAQDVTLAKVFDNDRYARANSELIAAAPDLLTAAISTVGSSHKLQDGKHDTPEGFVLVDEAAILALAQSINKAKGLVP